jgi:hypothetical protein
MTQKDTNEARWAAKEGCLPRNASSRVERIALSVEAFENQIPHISVMLTHSAAGAMVPRFVISPQLQQPPADVVVIMESFKAWVGSVAKGWQTRQSFFPWTAYSSL